MELVGTRTGSTQFQSGSRLNSLFFSRSSRVPLFQPQPPHCATKWYGVICLIHPRPRSLTVLRLGDLVELLAERRGLVLIEGSELGRS